MMNLLIVAICSLLTLSFSSNTKSKEEIKPVEEDRQYELIEVDSYSFRRAYHGHHELEGEELEMFMNRNPVSLEDYANSEHHPFYDELTRTSLLIDGNLNCSEIDTLREQFNLEISQNKFLKVKQRLLQDPEQIKTPSYELTFIDDSNIVLTDTLEFDWPPDVIFMKTDIDKDGAEELLSLYKWYIINGDNFDLKIYKLKNRD